MYAIRKTIEFSASHSLRFPDGSTEPLHGHNWLATIYCRSAELDQCGFVVDFLAIERLILTQLDHQDLNSVLPFNPTTENIARWICEQIPTCYQVDLREAQGNEASYYL